MSLSPTINPPKNKPFLAAAIILGLLTALGGMSISAQDKFTLTAPSGIAFSEFRGYEGWADVAVSQTDGGIKLIAANPIMIEAYKDGIPGNGKPFPEGSKIVKIEWSKKRNPEAPAPALVPDTLKTVEFIEKDSSRFPKSSGWGYAQFLYDAGTETFTEKGALPERAAMGLVTPATRSSEGTTSSLRLIRRDKTRARKFWTWRPDLARKASRSLNSCSSNSTAGA